MHPIQTLPSAKHRHFAIAAKVIKTGRKVIIKCQAQYYQLLTKVLNDIKAFKPPADQRRTENVKYGYAQIQK
jgi:hypothetical protein